MKKDKKPPDPLPRKNIRAVLSALSRKNFDAALDFVKNNQSFDWGYVYWNSKNSTMPSLLNALFPDTALDPSSRRLARSLLRECLKKGYDPSFDTGVMQDFLTECDRQNFKAFCDVIKDYPKDQEKMVWSMLNVSTCWWTDHFEYLLTPSLKNTTQNNIPFLLDVWRTHATEYPLNLYTAQEVCLSMKNCVQMGFETAGETPGGDLKELMAKAIALAYEEERPKIKECIDDLLAFMSKKDLTENLDLKSVQKPALKKM